jgi:hypothetical protein
MRLSRPGEKVSDPTDFEGAEFISSSYGNLPVIPPDSKKVKKKPKNNAATGASAAGVRAFTAQAVAFYFRAPVKAFFRTRVDYLAYARSLSQEQAYAVRLSKGIAGRMPSAANGNLPASGRYAWMLPYWRKTTPGLLAHAVRTYGWRVIPEQIMPPLVANVAIGAVLYTSYLQILGRLHEPSSHATSRVYPPPSVADTLTAGMLAGGIQSLLAAPLDALQVRYDRGQDNGNIYREKTMYAYGKDKLREIGVRGIFAGWSLSFAKDSLGSGVFFSSFEWVKAQGYYKFVRWYYSALGGDEVDELVKKRPDDRAGHRSDREHGKKRIIKPHYALEPAFLLLAGISATVSQQAVLYPLTLIQTRHFERLEGLDEQARKIYSQERAQRTRGRMVRAYYRAYQSTWKECKVEATSAGGMRRWLFRGFWWNTIRQAPSTSAGLIIFELVRRKYGMIGDEVKINQDGYDILLH